MTLPYPVNLNRISVWSCVSQNYSNSSLHFACGKWPVEVTGASTKSWDEAAGVAVETAAGTLRDLRIAEVGKMDLKVENGNRGPRQNSDHLLVAKGEHLAIFPFHIRPQLHQPHFPCGNVL